MSPRQLMDPSHSSGLRLEPFPTRPSEKPAFHTRPSEKPKKKLVSPNRRKVEVTLDYAEPSKVLQENVSAASGEPCRRLDPPPTNFRFTVIIMLLLCNCSLYISRANMSVAAVFMWPGDDGAQSLALGGFYLGYPLLQLSGGSLAARFGGKKLLECTVLGWSIAGMLTLPAYHFFGGKDDAERSAIAVFICRALLGVAEGLNYPAQTEIIQRWIPMKEYSSAWSWTVGGECVGTILAMFLCPFLADMWGWESIFWSSTIFGLVWLAVFRIVVAADPLEDVGLTSKSSGLESTENVVPKRPLLRYAESDVSSEPELVQFVPPTVVDETMGYSYYSSRASDVSLSNLHAKPLLENSDEFGRLLQSDPALTAAMPPTRTSVERVVLFEQSQNPHQPVFRQTSDTSLLGLKKSVVETTLKSQSRRKLGCISRYCRYYEEEREYIRAFRATQVSETGSSRKSIPYREILSSPPFLLNLSTHFAFNWAYYLMLSVLPGFFASQYGVDVSEMAFTAVLPYILALVVSLLAGPLGDRLLASSFRGASPENPTPVRKLYVFLAQFTQGASLILLALLPKATPETKPLALVLVCVGTSFASFNFAGCFSGYADLSPGRYSASVMALGNAVASTPGLFGNLSVRFFKGNYSNVFMFAAGLEIVGMVPFLIWGDLKDQKYGEGKEEAGCVTEMREFSTANYVV